MKFSKYEATGNDFIMIDARRKVPPISPRIAREICARHTGIGADGIVLMEKSESADIGMRIINSDGSEAEMCGNGIRALFLFARDLGAIKKSNAKIETAAGIKYVSTYKRDDESEWIKVDMGKPHLLEKDIPMEGSPLSEVREVQISLGDANVYATCLSMGNPHCVIFVEDLEKYDVLNRGPLLENHPLFPNRTNVEFVEVISPMALKLRVWERGVGETQSCGTGACAALVAANLKGLSGRHATVKVKGGSLEVEWAEDGTVFLAGPARFVFKGEFSMEEDDEIF